MHLFKLKSFFSSLWLGTTILISLHAIASMPEEMYKKALQIADKKIQKRNEMRLKSQFLSTSLLKTLFGRSYQVGDQWNIATWIIDHPTMRMTGDLPHLQDKAKHQALFHYEITEITNEINPRFTIKIEPILKAATTPSSPLASLSSIRTTPATAPITSRIQIVLNENMSELDRAYFTSERAHALDDSRTLNDSKINLLEFYPFSLPNLLESEPIKTATAPQLPDSVRNYTDQFGGTQQKIDWSKCKTFNSEDSFGRPIQIIWRPGDPWPTYIRTANGIALLIHKEAK